MYYYDIIHAYKMVRNILRDYTIMIEYNMYNTIVCFTLYDLYKSNNLLNN